MIYYFLALSFVLCTVSMTLVYSLTNNISTKNAFLAAVIHSAMLVMMLALMCVDWAEHIKFVAVH